jgi:hypothetical protein
MKDVKWQAAEKYQYLSYKLCSITFQNTITSTVTTTVLSNLTSDTVRHCKPLWFSCFAIVIDIICMHWNTKEHKQKENICLYHTGATREINDDIYD